MAEAGSRMRRVREAAFVDTAPEREEFGRHAHGVVRIGRAADNDLRLDDPMVSNHHARLQHHRGRPWLVDLNRANGTIVNGEVLRERQLHEGDQVIMGHTHLRFTGGTLVRESGGGLVVDDAVLRLASGRRIVNHVSLAVEPPSVTAIIGPSGSGKSSLLRLLTGETSPSSGHVYFRGASMTSQRQAFRGDIGVVPQFTIAHDRLTAREALHYTARLRFGPDSSAAFREQRVREVLAQLGLRDHADTPVERLSGGQQRRVSIAMEMLTEPTMLILDEPTSGLDPSLVLQIMEVLREFADSGKQVVLVTHDLAHLDLVDHLVVLRTGGTVAYQGPPDGVFEHFGSTTWAEVFRELSVPEPPKRWVASRQRPHATYDVPVPELDLSTILGHARTLVERQTRLFLGDRALVGLTIVMPLMLALLALSVPGSQGFAPTAGPVPDPNPGRLVAILTVGAAFLGLAGSMREIVREKHLYRHERAAGLSPFAYLLAKSLVLSVIVTLQSLVLVSVVLLVEKNPRDSLTFLPSSWELALAVCATAVSCVALGLAISARLGNSEQSTPPLILLVMTQLVLCGGLFPIAGRAWLAQLAYLTPARWGYASAASVTDLNAGLPRGDIDARWEHDPAMWSSGLLTLAVLGFAFWLVALHGVRRRERFG